MANDRPSMLKQYYDRLAAVVVLVILLGSLLYLILAGLQQRKDAAAYEGNLNQSEPTKVQLTAVDLTSTIAAIEEMKTPSKDRQLTGSKVTDANLFTPERRILCVKCKMPIVWTDDTCVHCSAEQPKEKKIDYSKLDTDGDGLTDQWEVANGLNPNDATDAEGDLDADGFTNIEESMAGTDPKDPKSHPSYEARFSVGAIEGVKLRLRAMSRMELPKTTDADGNAIRHFKVTFYGVSKDGTIGKTALHVRDGEAIGSTGFKFVRYNEKTAQVNVGDHLPKMRVNVSTIDVERIADGKKLVLTFYDKDNAKDWPGDPLLELKATINIDVPEVKPVTVAEGSTFTVKGETYTVRAIDAAKKTVSIEKKTTKELFELK